VIALLRNARLSGMAPLIKSERERARVAEKGGTAIKIESGPRGSWEMRPGRRGNDNELLGWLPDGNG